MGKKLNKKNIITGSVAVSLAAMMLIGGGTFAYLKDNAPAVKNNFNTNAVLVDLEETTGNGYNIIPGTAQDKNPKVSVTNTVDAWVYAIVEDNTESLVDYAIADGWQKLDGWNLGNTKVYYRSVSANDDVKEFPVLKDNKVSYDKALENSDMIDADGTLKAGLNLTFTAYAIQQEGFADAKTAFEEQYAAVGTADNLEQALSDGKTAVLSDDITLPAYLEVSGTVNIVGNGKKIVAPESTGTSITSRVINVNDQSEPVTINVKGADLVGPTTGTNTRGISVYASDNVTINIEDSSVSANYYALNIAGSSDNAVLNIKNSKITGWCAYQTWSPNTVATFDDCELIGLNDKTYNNNHWNDFATVVVNTDATNTKTIFNNCKITATATTGNNQYFMSIRASGTTVESHGSTFISNGTVIPNSEVENYIEVYSSDYLNFTID